jgi:peptide/nickel transport system permease protein
LTTIAQPGLTPVPSRASRALKLVQAHPSALVGVLIMLVFGVLAIAAPWIEPDSVTQASGPVYAGPSMRHWLGTDDGGIDMLSLLLQGARISMFVGFAAALVASLIGGTIGLLSGYFAGPVDVVLMRLTDVLLVIPVIPMMIVVAAVWGPSLFHIIVVIGVLLWTSTARVIRAQVRSVRERPFVKRARAIGAGNTRVLVRHVLPQVGPLLIANTVLTVSLAIFYETALDFLGLGDPTATSWGTIIQDAFLRTAISDGAWWAIVPAGLCVGIVVVGAYLIGQAVEDILNPRLRVAHLAVRTWRLRPLVGLDRRTAT